MCLENGFAVHKQREIDRVSHMELLRRYFVNVALDSGSNLVIMRYKKHACEEQASRTIWQSSSFGLFVIRGGLESFSRASKEHRSLVGLRFNRSETRARSIFTIIRSGDRLRSVLACCGTTSWDKRDFPWEETNRKRVIGIVKRNKPRAMTVACRREIENWKSIDRNFGYSGNRLRSLGTSTKYKTLIFREYLNDVFRLR